jgi:hypothetical protein
MRNKAAVVFLLVTGALATTEGLPVKGQGPVGSTTTTSERTTPPGNRPRLVAAPGWAWLMEPQELRVGGSFGQTSEAGIVSGYSHVDAGGGGLRIFFVQAGPSPRFDSSDYRLVILDAAGKRHLPKRVQAGGLGAPDTHLSNAIFTLGPEILPPGKAAYIAAERVTPRAE